MAGKIQYKRNGVRKPDTNLISVTPCFWCARLTANKTGVCTAHLTRGTSHDLAYRQVEGTQPPAASQSRASVAGAKQ